MSRGVARRLKQLDRAIAEQVEVVLDASSLEPIALEIRGDVPVCLRLIGAAGCFELARDRQVPLRIFQPAGVRSS